MSDSSADPSFRLIDTMQFETLPLFASPLFTWSLETEYVGRRLVYRPETTSTMDTARRLLDRWGLPSGAIVLTEVQTAGRGRAGRSWLSAPDVNLQFTLLLINKRREDQRPLVYVTPLALALAAEEVAARAGAEIKVDLKWPNDAQIDGCKLAGILIETTDTLDGRPVALVGVGVNVNLDVSLYPEIAAIATSLKDAAGLEIAREPLLAAFCNHFERLYEAAIAGDSRPFEQWRERLVTLGKEVIATGPSEAVRGTAVDVAEDGSLLIELRGGGRVAVDYGDVTLAPGN